MSHDRVGIRELRQNLSVYLRRVKGGEELVVTERGRTVALLAPLAGSAVERLVASGRATPAVGHLVDLDPPKGEPSTRLSRALESERQESLNT